MAQTAADPLEALYRSHYPTMVRTAYLLLRDQAAAEDAVQDAFIAVGASWRRLRDPAQGAGYLRAAVLNRCRSLGRHRAVVDRHQPAAASPVASAEDGALVHLQRESMLEALHRLPLRQREVLVLRYYADLSEAQIADAMGISHGAVKSHASRGLSALRDTLGQSR